MLDLPACVVPVTTVDPAKDGKATDVKYFSDTDKLIHDQCESRDRVLLVTYVDAHVVPYADDPDFAAGMPLTVQMCVLLRRLHSRSS